jgi:hypothetical protein
VTAHQKGALVWLPPDAERLGVPATEGDLFTVTGRGRDGDLRIKSDLTGTSWCADDKALRPRSEAPAPTDRAELAKALCDLLDRLDRHRQLRRLAITDTGRCDQEARIANLVLEIDRVQALLR